MLKGHGETLFYLMSSIAQNIVWSTRWLVDDSQKEDAMKNLFNKDRLFSMLHKKYFVFKTTPHITSLSDTVPHPLTL